MQQACNEPFSNAYILGRSTNTRQASISNWQLAKNPAWLCTHFYAERQHVCSTGLARFLLTAPLPSIHPTTKAPHAPSCCCTCGSFSASRAGGGGAGVWEGDGQDAPWVGGGAVEMGFPLEGKKIFSVMNERIISIISEYISENWEC